MNEIKKQKEDVCLKVFSNISTLEEVIMIVINLRRFASPDVVRISQGEMGSIKKGRKEVFNSACAGKFVRASTFRGV